MPKRYSSRELIRMVEADGWILVGVKGDHRQFKHPTKPGRVTIPHPRKDTPVGTAASILKRVGLK